MASGSTYDDLYRQFYDAPPPRSVEFGESRADIISSARGFVAGFDFTMQTQVGCPAGCLFCYVPAGWALTPPQLRGGRWGFDVRRKRDPVGQFAGHLSSGALADRVVYWSGVTDPYATRPGETRAIWQQLIAAPEASRPRRMIVQTRFRPDRDAQEIADYERSWTPADSGPAVVVSYSVGTDREDLLRAWERASPSVAVRLRTIETLRRKGIWVVPTLSPFGPWDHLERTLRRFQAWGIPYITHLFFKRAGNSAATPHPFLAYLEREHPMLLDPDWQVEQTRRMRAVFGDGRVLHGERAFASLAVPHRIH